LSWKSASFADNALLLLRMQPAAADRERGVDVANGVLIVGASLGGLRLAEQLRASGYSGPITMAGAERHMPYNRPPLSKDSLLDEPTPAQGEGNQLGRLAFSIRPTLSDVTWHLGAPAVAADLTHRVVTLADGRQLSYDALGIATGLTPRRLPLTGGELNRHVVRTIDDTIRLRAALTHGARVVVAGGGFIGCEVAASATKRGCTVTVVEPLAAPMCRSIGQELASAIQSYHEANGVRFRLATSIAGIECNQGRLTSVTLSDGSELPADVLIEAIGSTSNSAWLEGNALDLTDGVLTDNAMRVGGRADVAAAGDVARFPNPRYGHTPRRVEHWAIPGLSAKRAATSLAATLLGREDDSKIFNPIPTFWSDQFGIRLQSMGMPGLADRCGLMEGELSGIGQSTEHGLAMGYWRDDALIGVVTIGLPVARLSDYRAMLG
jgi:3-phenylpropionate/trans-cinnamate dioxygenase ferredoxin reductase component